MDSREVGINVKWNTVSTICPSVNNRQLLTRVTFRTGHMYSAHDNVRSSDDFRVIMPRDQSISYLRG